MPNHPFIQNQQARFDRLLAQQHLVRRFRSEHRADFAALRKARDGLWSILDEAAGNHEGMFPGHVLSALSSWLTVAESTEGRIEMRNSDVEALLRRLGGEPQPLNRAAFDVALDFLRGQLKLFEDLTMRFNYFDYCSFMSMASLCNGKDFAEAYEIACATKSRPFQAEVLAAMGAKDDPAFRLFHVSTLAWSLDLRCAVSASAAPERFNSKSIHILDSRTAPVLKVDKPSRPAIYLRIDLERAPEDIDHALLYLRGTLLERLKDEHGALWNIPDGDRFWKTQFIKAQPPYASILATRTELGPVLRGLWCWDLVQEQGIPKAAAAAKVCEALKIDKRRKRSVENQHDKVEQIIWPARGKEKLDEAITRNSGVRLGLRSKSELPLRKERPSGRKGG